MILFRCIAPRQPSSGDLVRLAMVGHDEPRRFARHHGARLECTVASQSRAAAEQVCRDGAHTNAGSNPLTPTTLLQSVVFWRISSQTAQR